MANRNNKPKSAHNDNVKTKIFIFLFFFQIYLIYSCVVELCTFCARPLGSSGHPQSARGIQRMTVLA